MALVRGAQAVCGAAVEGLESGSAELAFSPGTLRAGNYLLDAGAGGSIARLVQVLAVPLGRAGATSTLRLRGLTHGCAEDMPRLSRLWLPVLRELGHDLDVEVGAAGWPPEAGGEVAVAVRRAAPPTPLDRRSRGTLLEARVLSTVSNLPFAAAGRQSERALARLKEVGVHAEADNLPVRAPRSRGLSCLVFGAFERGRAGFCASGGAESEAESLADRAAAAFAAFLRTRGGMDSGLAEQLLVPLALAAVGRPGEPGVVSRLTTSAVEPGLVEVAQTVGRFLEVEVAVLPDAGGQEAEIRVAPREDGLVAALKKKNP